jgi:hypothetical protein
MTKTALTLAAVLLAGTTLSTAANAGGIRLGFGMPLGSFVAHSNQSYNSKPSYGYGEKKCAKKAAPARHYVKHEEPAPRKVVKHTAPKKIEVAEEAPVRRIKKVVKAPVAIQTAKLEDKAIISDAAPSIVVPETPPAAEIVGTQSTAAIEIAKVSAEPAATETAALVKEEVKAEPAKVETPKAETEEPKVKATISSEAKRICRRFSAAIAGLIDVPCE